MSVDDAALDAARHVGDPAADAAIAPLGHGVWAVNALLAQVTRNDSPMPEAVPPSLRRLALPELPPWACPHRVRRAQAFARRHLCGVTVGLFCASLPLSYTSKPGARVLRLAGRMDGDVDRRVHETARFVLDVLTPGGLDPGGSARIVIGKVRLIHAAVRAAILARGREPETPINQEDQAGTLGLFSVVVLKSLTRLGAEISAEERDDFVYLWRAIGAMLGVHEHLLPQSFSHGDELLSRIRARHMAASEDGSVLMRVLLDGMERHMPLPPLRPIPRALVRLLAGDDAADLLGVPATESQRLPSALLRATGGLVPRVGESLLELLTAAKLGGKPVGFEMPTRLGMAPA